MNKGLAEDLEEGKFSFPIIHSIRSDSSNSILINILKQKPKDTDIKKFAISHMEKTGSFAYSRKVLRDLERQALDLINDMEATVSSKGGEIIRAILAKLRVDEDDLPDLRNGPRENGSAAHESR